MAGRHERRTARCRYEFLLRLLRWRFRSRDSYPWRESAAGDRVACSRRREVRAVCGNKAAPARDRRKTVGWSSILQNPSARMERCSPRAMADRPLLRRSLSLRRVDSLDDLALAKKLHAAADAEGKCLPVLIEVHMGGEETKSGAAEALLLCKW